MKDLNPAAIAIALWLSAGARGETAATKCEVEHREAQSGATIVVAMSMINDGTPCMMGRHFGGSPAESLRIRARPASGTLSSTRSTVSYTPNPGFVGKDAFDVQWFGSGFGPNGMTHNIRTKVEVTIKAADERPEAATSQPVK